MTSTKNKRGPRPAGARRGGRPREVDGDAIEFTIRLGSNQLGWLERRYGGPPGPDGDITRTRAGLVRDLVDEVRSGTVRRAAHWPPRAVIGVFVDPRVSGVLIGIVALNTTASRPRMAWAHVFRAVTIEAPEALAQAVRQAVVEVEAEGVPVDLAAIGTLAIQADVGKRDAREQGIAWGLAFAALRGAALPVSTPADRDVRTRASVHVREAVTGFDAADGDEQALAAAVFTALAGIDREAEKQAAQQPAAS